MMSIRARLLWLSLFVAVSIVAITGLFVSAIGSIDSIDHEKAKLVALADSIRDLSIAVNSLDSNQYKSVSQKFAAAQSAAESNFQVVAAAQVLPLINDDLKNAFEVIGNMHALITEDLKALDQQFQAFKPDLEKYFLEAQSTSVRMFYTNERARQKNDLGPVLARLDDLVTSINGMTETLSGVSDTIQSQSTVINDATDKIRAESLLIVLTLSGLILVFSVGLSVLMGTSISRRVKAMQTGLVPVSQGDFSRYLPVKGSDEVATMTITINALLDSLNRLLREVKKQVAALDSMGKDLSSRMNDTTVAVDQIQGHLGNSQDELGSQTLAVGVTLDSAQRLEAVADRLAQAFQEQMDILASSSSGIEQIIANIGSVNANAEKAEGSSLLLGSIAREGQTKLNLVARSVEEISRSSENLVQVTAIINDIADKTNLLAMNASIEAAHAGTSGRGFGVVANEIRKLAEQAANQSKEISKDLSVVNENIHSIRSATGAAVDVFVRIVNQTELVGAIVKEVQASMSEQNSGGTLVLDGIRHLNEINGQVGVGVAEMERSEVEIREKVQDLASRNTRVNDNNLAVDQRVKEIAETVVETNALAGATGRQIEELKAETGRFTTSG